MNIFLWVLQVLLALHTLMGAVWKFTNSAEQSMSSLKALPHSVWIGLSVLEIGFSLALIFPVINKSLAKAAPIAAICIAAEMLLFCAVHMMSGDANYSPMIYWLVVAAVSGFIAYGRLVLKPL